MGAILQGAKWVDQSLLSTCPNLVPLWWPCRRELRAFLGLWSNHVVRNVPEGLMGDGIYER
jgi:hypothetical protein